MEWTQSNRLCLLTSLGWLGWWVGGWPGCAVGFVGGRLGACGGGAGGLVGVGVVGAVALWGSVGLEGVGLGWNL